MRAGAGVAALAAAAALAALAAPAAEPAGATACRQAPTRDVVERFLGRLAAGDVRSADRLFAAIGVFRWYSTTAPGARLGRAAYVRESLRTYLEARVRAGERLRLVRFRFTQADDESSLGHFNGALRRSARGFPPRTYLFKGAAECSSGEPLLVVWSMAGPVR
jgi:hypothetical protein